MRKYITLTLIVPEEVNREDLAGLISKGLEDWLLPVSDDRFAKCQLSLIHSEVRGQPPTFMISEKGESNE